MQLSEKKINNNLHLTFFTSLSTDVLLFFYLRSSAEREREHESERTTCFRGHSQSRGFDFRSRSRRSFKKIEGL